MAIAPGSRAPYAPAPQVIKVIDHHRRMGNLRKITQSSLQQIGVTEALAPRTFQSLVNLDFIDKHGNVTPEFDALRTVGSDDFLPRLAAMLTAAYADALTYIDPATATDQQIEDAFRHYEPSGQRRRMVQLFIGLMEYAGLREKQERKQPSSPGGATPRVAKKAATPRKASPPPPPPPPPFTPPSPTERSAVSEASREVGLRSGGRVTLVLMDTNVLALDPDDRDFVLGIVKQLEDYAGSTGAATGRKKGGGNTARVQTADSNPPQQVGVG